MDFNSIIQATPALPMRPHWLKIGTPCRLPSGLGLIVDYDETHLVAATKDGIEASIPIAWVTWQP